MKQISKHIFEVRFNPDPRFLDKRGQAAALLSAGLFDKWSVSTNRVDFNDSDRTGLGAFLSYANLGVTSTYPNTTKDFKKCAKEFVGRAWDHFDHRSIVRMGVRSFYLIETSNFAFAFDGFRRKFLKLSEEDEKSIGGSLIDLGFPLNFIDGENYFNIMAGPMVKDQSVTTFAEFESLPESGIYVEIDYFTKTISPHVVVKHARQFLEDGLLKADQTSRLIDRWINEERSI